VEEKLYPKTRFIIAADIDRLTAGNPGVKAATAAAKAVKGVVAVPSFNSPLEDDVPGTDFNKTAWPSGSGLNNEQRVMPFIADNFYPSGQFLPFRGVCIGQGIDLCVRQPRTRR